MAFVLQKIRNLQEIIWSEKRKPLDEKKLKKLSKFPFKLPKTYIELLKISDGGYTDYIYMSEIFGISFPATRMRNPRYDPYSFFNPPNAKEYFISYHDIINNYKYPPEFFPENLVAFAEDGGGNRTCFDYRSNTSSSNPPVVHWNHEASVDEDVSFIANNFDEFIENLELWEDDNDKKNN